MKHIRKKTSAPGASAVRQRGFTVLELLFVMAIVAILAAIALPAYNKFIRKARETAVISYLAKVVRAEELHYIASPTASYSADFDELEATGMINPAVGAGTRVEHEYTFTLDAGTASGKPYWNVAANPVDGDAAARWFYADETSVLRFEIGSPAGPSSPQVEN